MLMDQSALFEIIDCHNHSLPFIDDGAVDMDMAIEMLRLAEASGTSDIALTPHHLNGAFNNFAESTRRHTEDLRRKAAEAGIKIKLHLGSEVHLIAETAEQLLAHKALTYGGHGKAALIELPKSSVPTGVESILSQLVFNGITPVIAHPERNSVLRRDFTQLADWVGFGCLAQLTGQSCTGEFGDSIQNVSFEMIYQRLIHIVASDAHRPTGRSPDLRYAARVLHNNFGNQVSRLLLHDNPKRLLDGEELQALPAINRAASAAGSSKNDKKIKKRDKRSWLRKLIEFQ